MEQNQPDDPNVYNSGGQVIVQSDRLVFNAKKDSILMYAKNHMHVGINGSFHFNTNNINYNPALHTLTQCYILLQFILGIHIYSLNICALL